MKIIANYTRKLIDDKGNIEITFTVDNWAFKRTIQDLTKQPYSLDIKVPKSKRSLEQNRFLWEIIGQISKELNIDDWDIYCQLIEMAGAKYDYLMIEEQSLESISKAFRAIKIIKDVEHNGKTFKAVKAFSGSSTMNVAEMKQLIDITLDYAEQSGIDTAYYVEIMKGY